MVYILRTGLALEKFAVAGINFIGHIQWQHSIYIIVIKI